MNRWLLVVGIVCLVLAAFISIRGRQITATTPQAIAEPPMLSSTNGSQASPEPSKSPGGSSAASPIGTAGPLSVAPTESLAPAIPLPPITLRPTIPQLPYAAAHGRPAGLNLTIPTSGPGVAVQAMPQAGTAEVLTSSTLGGVESQQWVSASWALAEAGAVQVDQLTSGAGSPAGPLVIALDRRGIWTATSGQATPDLVAAAIEMARTITMLRGGLATGRTWAPGQEAILGGEAFRVVHAQPRLVLFAAVNDGQGLPALGASYPMPDAYVGWNDTVLWLDQTGAWTAAERLVGAPATRDEPGYLVRRSVIRPSR